MALPSVRVGFLLGLRQIQRTNIWVSGMIIIIMLLSFLFLVVTSGILVGLIEGGNQANRAQYTGDVIITTRSGEENIERTRDIVLTVATIPEVTRVSARIIEVGSIEANYLTRTDFSALPDTVGTQIAGIDSIEEDETTELSKYVVEGEYLKEGEDGMILLGANLLRRYASQFGDGFDTLDDVYSGDRVRVTIGSRTREFIVKGVIDSKVGEVSIRAFLPSQELQRMLGSATPDADEIVIRHNGEISDVRLKSILVRNGFDAYGKIQTAEEAIPQFLIDIKNTFALLGLIFGFVGIVMGTITVFIVVFINAVTRKKYIGILKAIGIKKRAIVFAYVLQSLFYAVAGSIIGLFVTYVLLVPSFQKHPLDFPFSDGILVAPVSETIIKLSILIIVTMLAGFVPAWLIARQNTLDTILGR